MAEELNMHFSSVFTREDTSSLPVPETKFNGTRGGSRAGSLGGAQQLTGGGSSRIIRDLQKPGRFSGEGSSSNFPWSPQSGPIQWGGGVVAEMFRHPPGAGPIQWGGGSSRHFS